jgi:dipeptidyl aminopeptidase/acylaminoacyl peptidase
MHLRTALAVVAAAVLAVCAPAAAAPPIEAYGKLPAVDLMRLSPDGDRFAFVAVVGDARQLVAATLEGKALIASAVGQAKVRDMEWVGEDHLLVTTSATVDLTIDLGYKYELDGVLQVDLSTRKAFWVFQGDRGVAQTVIGQFGTTSSSGKWFGYFGGITYAQTSTNEFYLDHGWPDLYQVDLVSGVHRRIVNGQQNTRAWVITAEGAVAAHDEYDEPTGRWRLRTGGWQGPVLIERKSPTDDVSLDGFGRSPGTVLVTDSTGDRSTVEEVQLKDGKAEELFSDIGVDDYLRDPVSHLLIGAQTTDEPGAYFFDPKLQARYLGARKAFKDLKMTLVSYSRDLGRMIVETEGTGDSGTYWVVDIASGKADPVGAAYPAIKPEDVGPTSLVSYKASDGLELDGVLTLPPGREARNLPLVVMPHGGPIGVSDKPGFDPWAQAFASRGYAVFQPNYRGSGGHDVALRQAGYGEWGGKMLSDIKDGLEALAAKGIVDPKRACIVGASYGGYAALAGVTLQHGLYRCAVSVAGPSDMTSFFAWQVDKNGDKTGITRYWRAATGADKLGEKVLKTISPTTYADKVDVPVLLIHGKDDTVVPIDQSREMESALKRGGKPVELLQVNGGDHWDLHEDARMATVTNSVAFVVKHNPPD